MNVVDIQQFFKGIWREAEDAKSESAIDMIRSKVVREHERLCRFGHCEVLEVEFEYQTQVLKPFLDDRQKWLSALGQEKAFAMHREHRLRMMMVVNAEQLGGTPRPEVTDPFVRPYMRYMEMLTCRLYH